VRVPVRACVCVCVCVCVFVPVCVRAHCVLGEGERTARIA